MKIIDKDLLNEVSEQAKTSPRLRMNGAWYEGSDTSSSDERRVVCATSW